MFADRRRSSSRWIAALVGSTALVLFAHASRAGESPSHSIDGPGAGALVLSASIGGALDAVLYREEGLAHLVLRAALYDPELADDGSILARIDGVLVDPVSHEPRATLSGELVLAADGLGHWTAILHPLDGPDPHKVEAGAISGSIIAAHAKSDEEGANPAPQLPALVHARTSFAWSQVDRF